MQAKKYFTPKAAFGQVLQPMDPLLWRTGRRCGDMRMLLHKCILRIKGHGCRSSLRGTGGPRFPIE